jgi:uncharacterized protein (TIGR02145 family)
MFMKSGILNHIFLSVCLISTSCDSPSDMEPEIQKVETHLNSNLTYGETTDIDGNVYKTIQIGTVTWMAENLRTTKYCNGNLIPNVTNENNWLIAGNSKSPAWAHYDNDDRNDYPYGKLYNWYTISDSRNICPCDWKVPSLEEWKLMINNLGSKAGGKMKTTAVGFWNNPNLGATNESGFSGLPSGTTWLNGEFRLKGEGAAFWVNTDIGGNFAETITLWFDTGDVGGGGSVGYGTEKEQGLAVRCIRKF